MDSTTGIVAGTVIAQLATLITLMFNARQARLRAERQRAEELEDRAAARKIELEDRAELARRVERTNDALTIKVDETAQNLHKAIAENTEKTIEVGQQAKVAFAEANHTNDKFHAVSQVVSDLNQRLLDQEKRNAKSAQ